MVGGHVSLAGCWIGTPLLRMIVAVVHHVVFVAAMRLCLG